MGAILITEGPFKGWTQIIPCQGGYGGGRKLKIGNFEIEPGKTDFVAMEERKRNAEEHIKNLRKVKENIIFIQNYNELITGVLR